MEQVSDKYSKRVTSKSGLVSNQAFATFKCECGSVNEMYLSAGLKAIQCKACYATQGGKSSTRLYRIWHNMKLRCENPTNEKFKWYGGKGITVCEEWQDFNKFYQDNVDRHTDALTIDRLDSSKGYSLSNTEWVTQAVNNARANNKVINQYDKATGALIATYESVLVAVAETSGNVNTISRCARGERRVGSGFIWKYVQDITEDWIIPIDSVSSNIRNKRYNKLNISGELLATYNTMNELLSANEGTKQVSISKYIRDGRTNGYKGFHWETA